EQLTDGDDAAVVIGRVALNVAHLIGQTKILAADDLLAGSAPASFATLGGSSGAAMELFTQLFGDVLAFVYHCFDRIVIYGYLSGLSRPEQVVHVFRNVVGVAVVSKDVLSQRTADYQAWVEAYARNHRLPIEWAEKGVRKEDHVLPWQRRMAKRGTYGVYFIFKSMEQGATFRVTVPKYPTKDPNYRILAHQCSRFTHYYFYIRDEVLGPIVMRVASFFCPVAGRTNCPRIGSQRRHPRDRISCNRACTAAEFAGRKPWQTNLSMVLRSSAKPVENLSEIHDRNDSTVRRRPS